MNKFRAASPAARAMILDGVRYSVIYADPPWRYNDKSMHRGGAERHYRTMSANELLDLPVSKLAEDSALLFMWATWPNLPVALGVMAAWGFEYKTCAFLWVKTTKDGSRPAMGMGHYTRANSEPCLLGTRGKASSLILDRGVSQVVMAPRLEHSAKPNEVRSRIRRLTGTHTEKIELFARGAPRPGWHSWGHEAESPDIQLVETT